MLMQDLLENKPSFVQPASRRNEVLGWVRDGLRDFSISRAAVSWGFPMPQDSAQTVYVWFDALLGYASGASQPAVCLSLPLTDLTPVGCRPPYILLYGPAIGLSHSVNHAAVQIQPHAPASCCQLS